MYLLPKIHKIFIDVPGCPVISNCGTPTEKVSEFLGHHLQLVIKGVRSYFKDTQDFLEKLKHLVGLYSSIPHEPGLEALYEKLKERMQKKIPSSDLVNMAEFVLKNNCFELDSKVKKNLLLLTHVSLWIRWKENFLRKKI